MLLMLRLVPRDVDLGHGHHPALLVVEEHAPALDQLDVRGDADATRPADLPEVLEHGAIRIAPRQLGGMTKDWPGQGGGRARRDRS